MIKYFRDLIIVALFGLVVIISYFYIPPTAQKLNKKISQSEDRQSLIEEYGNYLGKGLPEKNPALYFYWFSGQRKLSDLRVKQAIEEIKNTPPQPGKIQIWSLLNMGVVLKTSNHTIAIDTANLPFSQAHNKLAQIADIFLASHMDSDHYDSGLLQKALQQNKKVIDASYLDSGQTENIDGVKITAYQTDHRGDGNFDEPNVWFIVEADGFKLLHTGDGRDFKNKNEADKVYSMKDFDILLGNIMLHPYNIRDLQPKVFVPLHLYKFAGGQDLYQESTIEAVLNNHKKYEKDLQGIKKVYLLPGESFSYPLK